MTVTRRQFIKGSAAVVGVALIPFRLPGLPAELPQSEYKWLRVTLDVNTGEQVTFHSWDPPDKSVNEVRWEQDPDPQWTLEEDPDRLLTREATGDLEVIAAIGSDDWKATQGNLMSGPGWRLRGPDSRPSRFYGAWVYDGTTLVKDIDYR